MNKEDYLKIARWIGYVYAPIFVLVIGIFLYVEYRNREIEHSLQSIGSATDRSLHVASSTFAQ